MSPMAAFYVEKYLLPLFGASNDYQLINNMSTILCTFAFIMFVVCGFIPSPYGRYMAARPGPLLAITLDSRFGFMVTESASFFVPLALIYYSDSVMMRLSQTNKILLALFLLHYFQRSFIYSLLQVGGRRSALIILILQLFFCTYNGFLQGYFLINIALYPVAWARDPRFVVGIIAFLIGMLINIHSDHILRNLRKPGQICYKIPKGGIFEYVSAANYLGEIIEWWGYAIASWSFPAVSFALFTSLFLGWRACYHHIFYLEKFDDYPKNRKALIPFLL